MGYPQQIVSGRMGRQNRQADRQAQSRQHQSHQAPGGTHQVATVLLAISTVAVIFFTVFGRHGILHLYRTNTEVTALEDKNRKLESEIIDLKNRIYSLEQDPSELERIVREELGLSRPGEIVYIFPKDEKQNGVP